MRPLPSVPSLSSISLTLQISDLRRHEVEIFYTFFILLKPFSLTLTAIGHYILLVLLSHLRPFNLHLSQSFYFLCSGHSSRRLTIHLLPFLTFHRKRKQLYFQWLDKVLLPLQFTAKLHLGSYPFLYNLQYPYF